MILKYYVRLKSSHMAKIHSNGLISGVIGYKTYYVTGGRQYVKSRSQLSIKSMSFTILTKRLIFNNLSTYFMRLQTD